MTELVFGIKFQSSGGQQVAGDINTSAEAVNRLNTSAQKLNETHGRLSQANDGWRKNMAGVAASMRETSSASVELSAATQRILDRYDPLGTKLRSLQSDMSLLRKEMGNSTSDAAIKGFQGLENEIDKTRALMGQAGVATDGHGKAMSGLGMNTQYARRELMQLGKEALTGDFAQMPQTFASLVTHSNLLKLAMSPVGAVVAGVTAAAAVGVLAWESYSGGISSVRAELQKLSGDLDLKTIEQLNKRGEELSKELVRLRADASAGGWGWRRSAEEVKVYEAELRRVGKQIDENRALEERLGNVRGEASALAATSATAQRREVERQIAVEQTYHDKQAAGSHAEIDSQSKINELRKSLNKTTGDEQSKALKSTESYIASLDKETAAIGKNVYERKYLEASAKMLTAITQTQRDAIMSGFSAWSLATQAETANTAAQKANADAAQNATKVDQEYMSGIGKTTESLIEKANAAELENAKIGMTAEQLAALTGKRYDEQRSVLASRAAALQGIPERQAELDLINMQIGALDRLKSAETMKPYLENQKKANDEMNRGLTDALMRGWESGKGFGKNFVDTVKNMFNTMVLRPVISAIMSPVSGAIAAGMGSMGFSGGANASAMSGGSMGGFLDMGGLIWKGFSGGLTSGMGSMVTGMGNMFGSAAITEFGVGLSSPALVASANSAAAAAGMSGASSAMSMGSMVGTAMPYIAAAVAVYAIGKSLFGGGETRSGGHYGVNAAGQASLLDGPSGGQIQGDQIMQSIAGTNTNINLLLGKFGSSATMTGMTAYLEASNGGRGGAFAAGTVAGQSLVANVTGGGAHAWGQSLDQAGAAKQLADDLSSLTLMALQSAKDIPQYMQTVLNSIDPMKSSPQLINNTIAFADSLLTVSAPLVSAGISMDGFAAIVPSLQAKGETLAQSTERLAGSYLVADGVTKVLGTDATAAFGAAGLASLEARANFISLMGGVQQTTATMQNYYQFTRTSEQQHADSVATVTASFSALGVVMPKSAAEFDTLVTSIGTATPEASALTAKLLNLTPAFSQVTDSAETMAARLASISQSMVQAQNSVLGNTTNAALIELGRLNADWGNVNNLLNIDSGRVTGGKGSQDWQNIMAIDNGRIADLMAQAISWKPTASSSPSSTGYVAPTSTYTSSAPTTVDNSAALASLMSGINYTSITLGMSAYNKSLMDITRATEASVTQAALLGATEAQLATIRALGVAQATEATTAAEKARMDATTALSEQLFALQHTEIENAAHLRGMKLAELALQEVQLGMAAGTLTAIQNQINAQTDLNAATTAATAATTAATAATKAAKDDALAAANITLGGAQKIYDGAKSALLESYNRESNAAQQLSDKMRGFATSFAALRTSLDLGALSTLGPEQKYREAQRQFDDVTRRAQLGDTAAMGELANVSQSFLQASRDYNASSEAYARDFARVNNSLLAGAGVATRQADIASQQVTLMRDQLSALGLINTSVLSVVDALSAFHGASAGVATATAAVAAVDPVAAEFQAMFGRAPAAAGAAFWGSTGLSGTALHDAILAGAAPTDLATAHVRGYASGGDHMGGLRIVGERGMELEATGPSRIFNADQTRNILSGGGDNKELVAEMKALRAEVVRLSALVAQQTDQVVGAVDDAAAANTGDVRELKKSLAYAVSRLAA